MLPITTRVTTSSPAAAVGAVRLQQAATDAKSSYSGTAGQTGSATATRYPDVAVAILTSRAGAVLHNGRTVQLGSVMLLVALRKDNSTVVQL